MSYELKLLSKQSVLPVTPEEESEECQVNVDFCAFLYLEQNNIIKNCIFKRL